MSGRGPEGALKTEEQVGVIYQRRVKYGETFVWGTDYY